MPHEPQLHHRTRAGRRPFDRKVDRMDGRCPDRLGRCLQPARSILGLGRRVTPRRSARASLGEAIRFFAYDTPKVLMLLTLVVFGMGVVRSFFSPEKTRALLAGKREGVGNVLAAALGIVTPFCSCSAVPLFIGFVSAGVPLGVTFSFLISAPMVNEVALGLLFALVGWKVALTYLGFGLAVAIVSGWVIGRLHLEHWLRGMGAQHSLGRSRSAPGRTFGRRPHQGRYRRRQGDRRQGLAVDHRWHRRRRIHPRLCAFGPAGLDHGTGRLVVGAGSGADRHSHVFERRRHHPRGRGADHARVPRSAPCSPS